MLLKNYLKANLLKILLHIQVQYIIRYEYYIGKKTLCIDVKNILMNIYVYNAGNADAVLPVKSGTGELSIHLRPYAYDFLDDMRTKFELILYSSLSSEYLDAVLGYLEKQKKYFVHRFDESYCLFANISYAIKCADFLLENRTLENTIFVDSSVKAFPLSADNIVPISRYEEGEATKDIELVKLASILDLLAKEEGDVRTAINLYRSPVC